MFETGASTENSFSISEAVDGMYRWSTAEFGQPIGLNLFDPRLCDAIDFTWLVDNVSKYGATEQELNELLNKGMLKGFPTHRGGTGFLLYTPEQVKTLKALRATARYSDEELRYIMEMWNAEIECTLEVVPYDDPEVSDYDHLRGKLAEYIGETKRQIEYVENHSKSSDEERGRALEHFKSELEKSEKATRRLDSWNPDALTGEMNTHIGRSLFRLRWGDEWVRIENAQQFQTKVIEGYGPEVFFSAWSHSSAGVTFERIDWRTTLEAFQRTRSQGRVFPLRTPDFDLVDRGMILRQPMILDAYADLCNKYRIDELRKIICKMGPDLWTPPLKSIASASCVECGSSFTRNLSTKQYCSDKCRSRAKQRRYRERDPERARLSQVRYWTSYLEPTGEN
jgi:hypothetical protein